jgi:hypothetical protein
MSPEHEEPHEQESDKDGDTRVTPSTGAKLPPEETEADKGPPPASAANLQPE